MKKILVTILAFTYLSSTLGATLHFHYCMGNLVSWGFVNYEGKQCSFCGMLKSVKKEVCKKPKVGCCKDEHKQFKTDKDQKPSQITLLFSQLYAYLPNLNSPAQTSFDFISSIIEQPTDHSPPLTGKIPVYLLFSNIRI